MSLRRSTALLWGGLLAGPAFVVVYTVEGARRPGYDELRHPVSSLALGPRGWVNFAVGIAYLGLARGLRGSITAETGQSPLLVYRSPPSTKSLHSSASGGLFQRAAVMSCLGWVTALAGRTLRRG
jgi:hypothetical protein